MFYICTQITKQLKIMKTQSELLRTRGKAIKAYLLNPTTENRIKVIEANKLLK